MGHALMATCHRSAGTSTLFPSRERIPNAKQCFSSISLSISCSLCLSLALVLWLLLFLFSLLFVLVYSATIVVSFGIVICCSPCLLSRCLFVSSVSRDSPYPYRSLLPLLLAGPFNPGSQQVLAEDNGPKPKPAGGVGPFGGVLLSRFLSLLLLSLSVAHARATYS